MRGLGLLVVFFAAVLGAMALRYRFSDSAALFEIVAQLDLYHALFYALLPTFALLLLTPLIGRASRMRVRLSLAPCLLLAALVGWLPLQAALFTRPSHAFNVWTVAASIYLALNVFCIIWLHLNGLCTGRIADLLFKGWGLADLLAPTAVWSAYRTSGNRALTLARAIPALLVTLVGLLPWLFAPQSIDSATRFHPALTQLREPPCYQTLADPRDGSLIVTTDENLLLRLEPHCGDVLAQIDTGMQTLQSVALDLEADQLLASNPAVGRTLVLDPRSYAVEHDAQVVNRLEVETNKWRTVAPLKHGLIASYSMNLFALLDAEGSRIAALYPDEGTPHYTGGHADALYLPQNDELLVTIWDVGKLMVLDAQTLAEKRWLPTPIYPERMALDPQTNRLLITLPLPGQLMLVDLERFEEIGRVDVFPGVRVIAVDPQNRLLLLAGFSPVIELRNLDDLSLIDRIHGPPWARWASIDPQRNSAYICSGWFGVFRIDLDRLGPGSPRAKQRRNDVFYPLVGRVSRLVQRLIWPANKSPEGS
ncbi:MAG: hypothetical protein P9M14_03810 [Candidatus Alcyoniella australis]|nr:hypothetical protein [Candidatus Alcyoniella australis]